MTQRRTAGFLAVVVLSLGCAYYNGLYNANRLARDAARAQREGRGGESRSLWEEAAAKAESVSIRYPRSRYRDDAWFLQGRALAQADRCGAAVTPLTLAMDSSQDAATRRDARLLLGQCRVRLEAPSSARSLLDPLLADPDPAVAREARVWRARASLAQADYAAALADLGDIPDGEAAMDRATAQIGLGHAGDAAGTLMRAAPGAYDERRWPAVLDALGTADREAASALVDSLVTRANLTPGQHARLMLADAARWRPGDTNRERARLLAARAAAPDSTDGQVAAAYLVLVDLRASRDAEDVPLIVQRLNALEGANIAAGLVGAVIPVLQHVIEPGWMDRSDAARFLAIERVRDLGAGLLAAALFRELQRTWPDSPLAPKALLASALLDPDGADAVLALAASRYPDSPYLLSGLDSDAEERLREAGDTSSVTPRARPAAPRNTPATQAAPLPPVGRRLPEP